MTQLTSSHTSYVVILHNKGMDKLLKVVHFESGFNNFEIAYVCVTSATHDWLSELLTTGLNHLEDRELQEYIQDQMQQDPEYAEINNSMWERFLKCPHMSLPNKDEVDYVNRFAAVKISLIRYGAVLKGDRGFYLEPIDYSVIWA